jgi:ubiquinone/menaquinone biosynthesis C-methylase UbiE
MRNQDTQRYKDFYTGIAHQYDATRYETKYGRVFRRLHHETLMGLLRDVSKEKQVLEVACGTGHTTRILKKLDLQYFCCDLTPGMVFQASEELRTTNFFVANAFKLPLSDSTLDVVISTRFLHLFPLSEQKRLLKEFYRVLRPGGKMIVDFDYVSSHRVLALPKLGYNLIRYRRVAADTNYNSISDVETFLGSLGANRISSIGVGGYHLWLLALLSSSAAVTFGRMHRGRPLRLFAEQFVTVAEKPLIT